MHLFLCIRAYLVLMVSELVPSLFILLSLVVCALVLPALFFLYDIIIGGNSSGSSGSAGSFFQIIFSLVCDFCKLLCLCVDEKHMGTFCALPFNIQLSVPRDLQSLDTVHFPGCLGLCTIF